MESFKPVAGSSHNLFTGKGLDLTSEIGLITAFRFCNPQLLNVIV
jgi:hypothetical protein